MTCAITQNGAVRILSQRNYSNPVPTAEAVALVAAASAAASHEFWPDDISILDANAVVHARLLRPAQLTDVYLLALAVAHHGRFVTFDRGLSTTAAVGATEDHLVVL